jgi:nicotinate-nucleotide adenylyltransferase
MDTAQHSRIGILGGTFNPVHIGHLILAQSAVEAFDLGKVLFVPCGTPPHKSTTGLIAAEHRLAMVEAAIEGDLRFEALDIEVERPGVSYAVDTVAQIRQRCQGADLFFIIGSDTLPELHLWREIRTLLTLCRFITFARPGFDVAALKPETLQLEERWARALLDGVTSGRQIDVSSSDIRYRIAEGLGIRYLVPGEVEMYIAEHRLYV